MVKFMFSKKATKSSPSIWQYVVTVKSTVNISSIFVAFLENMNFTILYDIFKSIISLTISARIKVPKVVFYGWPDRPPRDLHAMHCAAQLFKAGRGHAGFR